MGGALHCQVEHHVRDNFSFSFSFLSCITKMGQNFMIFFVSRYTWYLLHTESIVKFDDMFL